MFVKETIYIQRHTEDKTVCSLYTTFIERSEIAIINVVNVGKTINHAFCNKPSVYY